MSAPRPSDALDWHDHFSTEWSKALQDFAIANPGLPALARVLATQNVRDRVAVLIAAHLADPDHLTACHPATCSDQVRDLLGIFTIYHDLLGHLINEPDEPTLTGLRRLAQALMED